MKYKLSFNSLDCVAIVKELQSIEGSRVNQVYDVDNKTYLFKLTKPNSKKILLLMESGVRLHITNCDWPKSSAPSGFTMKLRKHISNKRITHIRQLKTDRIIDLQFGSGEVAFHIILELYSRGNIILTDYNFTIVSLLRTFVDGDTFDYAVHGTYPIDSAKEKTTISLDVLCNAINNSKKNVSIKRILLHYIDVGSSLLEDALIKAGFDPETKVKSEFTADELNNLNKELNIAGNFLKEMSCNDSKGYIIFEKENANGENICHMFEFVPWLFIQHKDLEIKTFETLNEAVDEYFSKIESEKIERRILEQKNDAMRKVNKIRDDQSSRLEELSAKQQLNRKKAEFIMSNSVTVDEAINILRSAIASQMSWSGIKNLVEEATRCKDPIASLISAVNLEVNQISMKLSDPYAESETDKEIIEVQLDLSLSAHANAKRYYEDKKYAALKEKKTLESQKKALKSAEKKAREALKVIKSKVSISKTRKIYWFEKFYWFISSENYLVIGGRDQKQNEVIVKRYMKAGDLYVHADVQGASSVIIKNPSGKPVPPRTLDEAGVMAVCFSNAWSSKILFNAWWVYHNQVSKTAPSGEYLVTGSFMIRGQKNYLLPQHLHLGFSFLFKIDDSSIHRHINERKVKVSEDDSNELSYSATTSEASGLDKHVLLVEQDVDTLLLDQSVTNEDHITKRSSESSLATEISLPEPVLLKSSPAIEAREINNIDAEDDVRLETEINVESEGTGTVAKDNDSVDNLEATCSSKKKQSGEDNYEGACSAKKSHSDENVRNKPLVVSHQVIQKEQKKSGEKDELKETKKYKRGQKSRQKKIKEKYKDQDDEEKELRMSILQSAGTPKKTEKKKKRNSKRVSFTPEEKQQEKKEPLTKSENLDSANKSSDDPKKLAIFKNDIDDEEEEIFKEINELNMLSSLTGQPHKEDEILFALPIVAPYTSILNNKFKIKMIPGMTRRGKAARSAVELFLRSKECLQREKEVIKAVDDQSVTRNFPGKVKIIMPQKK